MVQLGGNFEGTTDGIAARSHHGHLGFSSVAPDNIEHRCEKMKSWRYFLGYYLRGMAKEKQERINFITF